ncbi:MAG: glutamyl-tRNA reductase [Halobacteria archaeon]
MAARSYGGPGVRSLVSAHVTHRWATIDQLEMASTKEARSLLRSVKEMEGVEECALLRTCNRVEIYAVARDPAGVRERLGDLLGNSTTPDTVRFYSGEASARHLLSVAAGLDSMIVGEGQILGQVREAYRFARQEGTAGRTLDALFQKALSTGKEARARTAIGRGNVSIGSATVELARKLCGGSLEGRSLVILGAGDMARAVARSLVKQKVKSVTFANRTLRRARDLAGLLENGGAGHPETVPLASMAGPISRADLFICASSAPHAVVGVEEMESILRRRSRAGLGDRPLFVIDISNPRNVDRAIGELPGVRLYNIDGLREVARKNLQKRRAEMARVEGLVDRAVASLAEKGAPGEDLLRRLYRNVERVKAAELERSLRKLNGTPGKEQEAVLRALVDSIANKILAGPAEAIRKASGRGDARLLRSAEEMFRLDGSS